MRLRDVSYSYRKAHEVVWDLGCWKFLLVPIMLSFLLAAALFGACFGGAAWLSDVAVGYLSEFFELPEWIRTVFVVLLLIFGMAPCYVLFRGLVMICYGPFLDRLSVTVEKLILGDASEANSSFWESMRRPALMAFYTLCGVVGVLFASATLGAIPLVGILFSGCFVFPANLFLSSIGYLDPLLERRGYAPKESFDLMRKHWGCVIYFGFIGLLLTLIPFVGWFVGPTYSVVAGLVYSALLFQEYADAQ